MAGRVDLGLSKTGKVTNSYYRMHRSHRLLVWTETLDRNMMVADLAIIGIAIMLCISVTYSAPCTPCLEDSSSLGICHCVGQDATIMSGSNRELGGHAPPPTQSLRSGPPLLPPK